jgi:hypothetical protein
MNNRNQLGKQNPHWKGGKPRCDCGVIINYRNQQCRKCCLSNRFGINNPNYKSKTHIIKYCIDCHKKLNKKAYYKNVKRCQSCTAKHRCLISSNNPAYKDGRTIKIHVCKCCHKPIGYKTWRYGKKRCRVCYFKYSLTYGTLLGAVRENNFISHDTDIDLAYISKFHTKEEASKERLYIIEALTSYGFLRSFNTVGIKVKYNTCDWFDIWASWINENGNYNCIPYLNICRKETVLPLQSFKFRDETFFIPKQSEKLLDAIYKDWKQPIKTDYNKNFERFIFPNKEING